MAADFKSHILSRDEKGFGGIPFKRLLLGGIGGGSEQARTRRSASTREERVSDERRAGQKAGLTHQNQR